MIYDIAVIGGGAAGLTSAIIAKNSNPDNKIVVIEALERVGKKLITTGNGRCNITNRFVGTDKYRSDDINAVKNILANYGVDTTVDFFESIGVNVVFEKDGRAYPMSYQAASVVDALRFTAEEKGVEFFLGTHIDDIVYNGNYELIYKDNRVLARSVIIAAGLLSGGNKIGSDGKIFNLLKSKGLKAERLSPSIVQLKTDTDITRQLKGIKLNANVTFLAENKPLRQEFGEVLFTDYGLSGPPILQVSGLTERVAGRKEISLDLIPNISQNELLNELRSRRERLKDRTAENFLVGFINKRVGQVLSKKSNVNLNGKTEVITDNSLKTLALLLKDLRFNVTATTGFINSQVTSGGIMLQNVSANDLQCKKFKGMFFAGEILNVDGDCGGYNLQWAWSSAMAAANGATRYLRDKNAVN